jgi:hypothetical protein
MKNFWKFWGIIALVAVIGFGLAGCKSDSDDDDDDVPGPGPGPGPGGAGVTFALAKVDERTVTVTVAGAKWKAEAEWTDILDTKAIGVTMSNSSSTSEQPKDIFTATRISDTVLEMELIEECTGIGFTSEIELRYSASWFGPRLTDGGDAADYKTPDPLSVKITGKGGSSNGGGGGAGSLIGKWYSTKDATVEIFEFKDGGKSKITGTPYDYDYTHDTSAGTITFKYSGITILTYTGVAISGDELTFTDKDGVTSKVYKK